MNETRKIAIDRLRDPRRPPVNWGTYTDLTELRRAFAGNRLPELPDLNPIDGDTAMLSSDNKIVIFSEAHGWLPLESLPR